jgi:hypothetical protein
MSEILLKPVVVVHDENFKNKANAEFIKKAEKFLSDFKNQLSQNHNRNRDNSKTAIDRK